MPVGSVNKRDTLYWTGARENRFDFGDAKRLEDVSVQDVCMSNMLTLLRFFKQADPIS